MASPVRRCKVCVAEGLSNRRKIKARGMCATHLRAANGDNRQKRREKHVSDNFGITEEQYQAILAYQNGCCYICQFKPKPGGKRLSVDHDHSCTTGHDPKKGCISCVRGLLCQSCNFRIVARLKDDPAAFRRGAQYLEDPPARRVLFSASGV